MPRSTKCGALPGGDGYIGREMGMRDSIVFYVPRCGRMGRKSFGGRIRQAHIFGQEGSRH